MWFMISGDDHFCITIFIFTKTNLNTISTMWCLSGSVLNTNVFLDLESTICRPASQYHLLCYMWIILHLINVDIALSNALILTFSIIFPLIVQPWYPPCHLLAGWTGMNWCFVYLKAVATSCKHNSEILSPFRLVWLTCEQTVAHLNIPQTPNNIRNHLSLIFTLIIALGFHQLLRLFSR